MHVNGPVVLDAIRQLAHEHHLHPYRLTHTTRGVRVEIDAADAADRLATMSTAIGGDRLAVVVSGDTHETALPVDVLGIPVVFVATLPTPAGVTA